MEELTKISIRIGDSVVDGILYDNKAARSFTSLLPLTITLSDYENTEKCGDLPENLNISEEIHGFDPVQGDIAYYNPCGCLSIFFRDDGLSSDLVGIGRGSELPTFFLSSLSLTRN